MWKNGGNPWKNSLDPWIAKICESAFRLTEC
jgi:hypothetical protein